MAVNTMPKLSLLSILRENAALIIMYVLGTWLVAPLGWLFALLYLGYAVLSNALYMAWVCPYCPHYPLGTCPAGFHILSGGRFKAKAGRKYSQEFKRNVAVLFPGWFAPPILGLYWLLTGFSWGMAVLLAAFCLVGFVILPADSKRHCDPCENMDCPRRKVKNVR
jgi:hypothetical protein